MMQVAMVALFAFIVSGWSAIANTEKLADHEKTVAEVKVSQFMDFRAAAIRYIEANPAATEGVLDNGLLSAHALPGTVISESSGFAAYWKKTPGGAGIAYPGLYVYSKTAVGVREASILAKKLNGSILAGLASGGGTKYIVSPVDNNSTIVLPSAANIQPGSLVVFGR